MNGDKNERTDKNGKQRKMKKRIQRTKGIKTEKGKNGQHSWKENGNKDKKERITFIQWDGG